MSEGPEASRPSISIPAPATGGSASTSRRPSTTPPASWVDNGRRLKRLVDRVSEHHLQALLEQKQEIFARKAPHPLGGPRAVMARFCAYAEKVFRLSERFPTLTDSRPRPRIKTAAAFAGAFTLFATRRGSLNGLEQDLRIPARLRGLVGAGPPSVDSIGRIYALMDSRPLRQLLRDVAHRLKRNKALTAREGYYPRGRRWP